MLKREVHQVLEVFRQRHSLPTAAQRWNRLKDAFEKELNTWAEMPISYAFGDRNRLLSQGEFSRAEMLEALPKVDAASASSALDEVLWKHPVDSTAFAMGNVAGDEVTHLVGQVVGEMQKVHTPNKASIEGLAVKRLAPIVDIQGPVELRKMNPRPKDGNDVTVVTFVHGVATIESRAAFTMLGRLVGRLAFQKLRAEEQLGYVVWGMEAKLSNVLMLQIAVQGNAKRADEVEAYIEHFLSQVVPERLAEFTQESWVSFRQSVKDSLLQPPVDTGEEVQHF